MNSEVKTFIHLGQHKTGTTSIQSFLSRKRQSLLEQGVFVPIDFCGRSSANHYELNVVSLAEGNSSPMKDHFNGSIVSLRQEIVASISCAYEDARRLGAESVVWSNEGLSFLRTKYEFENLLEFFKPHSSNLTAILCIRDKQDFKESWQKQIVKMGLHEDNPPFDSYKYLGPDAWMLDWGKRLPLIIDAFDSLRVWKYKKQSSVQSFLQVIDVNPFGDFLFEEEIVLNKSV